VPVIADRGTSDGSGSAFAGLRILYGVGLETENMPVAQSSEVSMNTQISIERAELRHVDEIAPLFDDYRRFYGRADDPRARSFLEERVARHESVVFVARLQGAAIGFSQLYPCFASVSLARMFVLYDLFVAPQARRCGAAAALLRAGVDYAAGQGAGELMLQTGVTNLPAQRLYEREGWVRDNDFYVYEYHLPTDEHA
jgi:ribosomal protein S18 acetylase RimI-like enzyme